MVRNILIAITFLISLLLHAEEHEIVVFEGYDRVMGWDTKIVFRDGKYYMDNEEMEELRHRNISEEGLSLAIKNRIGEPNIYWIVLPYKLDIFMNCEYGLCSYKRSILGRCCNRDEFSDTRKIIK